MKKVDNFFRLTDMMCSDCDIFGFSLFGVLIFFRFGNPVCFRIYVDGM